ncbi:hypothetical protein EX30DRAFT_350791 [Ascodesmis nigricans]|uniref:Uncharacterized protein n=1 Tax=Ascodesmis nigricans TaxID=341454 RepID=A0A4S2MSE3_9PEZI|nr:hypothetical protein EX30DRAFT_350791 [Ascodesmis nigricans]
MEFRLDSTAPAYIASANVIGRAALTEIEPQMDNYESEGNEDTDMDTTHPLALPASSSSVSMAPPQPLPPWDLQHEHSRPCLPPLSESAQGGFSASKSGRDINWNDVSTDASDTKQRRRRRRSRGRTIRVSSINRPRHENHHRSSEGPFEGFKKNC